MEKLTQIHQQKLTGLNFISSVELASRSAGITLQIAIIFKRWYERLRREGHEPIGLTDEQLFNQFLKQL